MFTLCLFDKKLELRLMVLSALLKIKFGYAKISEPKIGMTMLKTDCINPSQRQYRNPFICWNVCDLNFGWQK